MSSLLIVSTHLNTSRFSNSNQHLPREVRWQGSQHVLKSSSIQLADPSTHLFRSPLFRVSSSRALLNHVGKDFFDRLLCTLTCQSLSCAQSRQSMLGIRCAWRD